MANIYKYRLVPTSRINSDADLAGVRKMMDDLGEQGWYYMGMNESFVLMQKTKEVPEPEVVWENECQLVFSARPGEEWGEMGLCYPNENPVREVQVRVRETGGKTVLDQLRGVPVRITIERVPGGNI